MLIKRLLKRIFWGKLSVERFPPDPLQRLLVPEKTPEIRGFSQEELKVFGKSLRETFYKKVLSIIFQQPFKRLAADLGILALSLFLSYNTYKEIMRALSPLSMELRDALKASFPEALLIFATCFLLSRPLFRKKRMLFLIYGAAVNAFFYLKGGPYLFVHNIGLAWFALLSWAFSAFARLALRTDAGENFPAWAREARRLASDLPGVFFFLFFISIASCGALAVLQHGPAAKTLADVSYFLLLSGLITEFFGPGRGR
ncbi:hypothetical protein KJ039_02840 [bacterium]|nr:hypothetical protein [bacterium]